MIFQLVIFSAIIILLYFISRSITNSIYLLLYLLSRNRKLSLIVLSLFFLPGTIIHEVSHWIVATVLRVPTGELSILPTINEGTKVQAGKLMIGKTDPFRYTLIGLAPIFSGLAIIYILGKFFFPDLSSILNTKYLILNTSFCYLLFSISATMFSSKKDLESMKVALPLTILLFTSFYVVGIKVKLENNLIAKITEFITRLNYYLLFSSIIDFLILITVHLKLLLVEKIFKVRAVGNK